MKQGESAKNVSVVEENPFQPIDAEKMSSDTSGWAFLVNLLMLTVSSVYVFVVFGILFLGFLHPVSQFLKPFGTSLGVLYLGPLLTAVQRLRNRQFTGQKHFAFQLMIPACGGAFLLWQRGTVGNIERPLTELHHAAWIFQVVVPLILAGLCYVCRDQDPSV